MTTRFTFLQTPNGASSCLGVPSYLEPNRLCGPAA
ncbi:mCG142761 [Mus musculus]|nr:mCG142761 [Mus musculus]